MEKVITARQQACIFPAFGAEYLGNERDILVRCGYDLGPLMEKAERVSGFDRSVFLGVTDGDFTDELQSQYAIYLYGCAVSDILERENIHGCCCAGYSMGIYAALYHCGSCSFDDGLRLIDEAYRLILDAAAAFDFGMGVVVGPDLDDLRSVIRNFSADVEIININNRHSFTVAGIMGDVVRVLDGIKAEGALNTRLLSMKAPYHSKHMDSASDRFRDFCGTIGLNDPRIPLVSTIDQKLILTRADVIGDLCRNINHNINWHETMSSMVGRGVSVFYECGPGRTLQKLAKFIDGDFTIITMKKLADAIGAAGTSR